MKKTLLIACTFISFATTSQAQITKGSVLLGGSIGLNKSKTEDEVNANSKSHSINFSPTVGLAVRNNWVLGVSASYSRFTADPNANYMSKQEDERFSGGAFARRYAALGKNFYLYGNGSINYGKSTQSYINNIDERYSTYKGVTLSVAPGIAYTINKWFHLEASLNDLLTVGYTTSNSRYVSKSGSIITTSITKGKSFNIGTSASNTIPLTIGFRFVLGK